MFNNALPLFEIAGFRVRVDPSWLLIAALIVWSLATGYFPVAAPAIGGIGTILLAVTAMLALFASLILHELSHSLVARRFGLGVGAITLFLFGGVAELEAEPRDARSEFWIAIAGPIASFAIAAAVWVIRNLAFGAGAGEGALALLDYLAAINLVLAVFNLLPAFPLDGGRVLRAWLWARSGDLVIATQRAVRVSTVIAYVLIGLGVLALFTGGGIGSLWQIMIGVFVLAAGRATARQVETRTALAGRTVASVMSRAPRSVRPEDTVLSLVDDLMLRYGNSFVPVVDGDRLLGCVDARTIQKLEREDWPRTQISTILTPSGPANTLAPEMPLEEVLEQITASGQRKFLVARGDRLLGVVCLSDLTDYVRLVSRIGDHARA